MWRVTHPSSDRLSFLSRESWFGQAFFSLFLFAGLGVLYGLLFVGIPKLLRNPPKAGWEYLAGLLPLTVGGVFAWIGAWGVAGRRGIDFDRSRGVVTVWSGYFIPMWQTRFDLKSFERVTLEPAARTGGPKTRHWEYPISVTGPSGARVQFEVLTPEEAAIFAHEIATFLKLKVSEGWRVER